MGGHAATEAKEKAFDRTCATLFSDLLARYNNLAEVDKLSAVSQKIDAVKMTMQENVSMALSNCVKLEQIEQATGKNEFLLFLVT